MNRHHLFLLLVVLLAGLSVQAQRTLSEGAVFYDVSVQTGSSQPQMADMFDGAKAVMYLRGTWSRSELNSALGNTATVFDNRSGNGIVLREFGAQKLLIRMNRENWSDKNRKYEGIKFTPTGETKTIAGYACERAEAVMQDGTRFSVFFTRDIRTENGEYDPQFRNLPGLALEYESVMGNLKVKYTASRVSFDPVPMQKFETPKSGYRELTYEESIRKVN
jgi:GLPGLI family protein